MELLALLAVVFVGLLVFGVVALVLLIVSGLLSQNSLGLAASGAGLGGEGQARRGSVVGPRD